MDHVVDILASSVGSLTNANKLANTFVSNGIKTSDKIVKTYIGFLIDTLLMNNSLEL